MLIAFSLIEKNKIQEMFFLNCRALFRELLPRSGAYPGIGQGGGTSQNFLLGLLKCRFPYLERTVMERCIFACFLFIPYS